MKEKSPYSGAHITLKRLWDERIAPTGMSQEEFGEKYDIGTQGMVSQYLLGTRPLNYDAAAKFARGFDCSIEDICPAMARTLLKDIIPVLRGSLRRRRLACVAIMSAAASVLPTHDASAFDNKSFSTSVLVASLRNTHWMQFALSAFRKLRARFCKAIEQQDNGHTFAYA